MKKVYLIIGALLLIAGFPLFLDFAVFGNRFPSNISNSDWAGFLGSYLGGISTLAAVFITIHDNNKKLDIQRQEYAENQKEEQRRSIQPFIETKYTYFSESVKTHGDELLFLINATEAENEKVTWTYSLNGKDLIRENAKDNDTLMIQYTLRNAGAGSAVNGQLIIGNNASKHRLTVAKDETVNIYLIVRRNNLDSYRLNIKYYYSDIQGLGDYKIEDQFEICLDSNHTIGSTLASGQQEYISRSPK
jgi:hypothetical protein